MPPLSGPVSLLVHYGSPIHPDHAFRARRAVSNGFVQVDRFVEETPLVDNDSSFATLVEDLAIKHKIHIAEDLIAKPMTGTLEFTNSVTDLAALFDGSEEIVSVLHLPVYLRRVYLPD